MHVSLGHGLASYVPSIVDKAFDDELAEDEIVLPPLFILADEEQKQLCAVFYMQRERKMCIEFLHGIIHRRHNDSARALAIAGFYDTVVLNMFR